MFSYARISLLLQANNSITIVLNLSNIRSIEAYYTGTVFSLTDITSLFPLQFCFLYKTCATYWLAHICVIGERLSGLYGS